ncbi:MAG: hypothetical protein AAFW98_03535 [Pseudomonadota bacterium]
MRTFATLLATTALALTLAGPAGAQQEVGVTGAVNPQSELNRSGSVRTIVIGEDVLFQDRIITGEIGLVQVMFVDGSTFTVGPTARVVIDEFVFNPATDTGSLVAEVTGGALRFVGGKLSKGNNDVRFRTPAGTLGVRGGIVNIDQDPECLEDGRCPTATASLVFGRELTVALPDGGRRRIHQPGYSFVFFADGRVEIIPTSELRQSRLQDRLTGQPGRSGGSPNIPTNPEVAQSGLPEVNSERRPITVLPRPKPVIVTSRYSPETSFPGIAPTADLIQDVFIEPAREDLIDDETRRQAPPPTAPGGTPGVRRTAGATEDGLTEPGREEPVDGETGGLTGPAVGRGAIPGIAGTTNLIEDVFIEPATEDFIDGVIAGQEPPFPVRGDIAGVSTPETFVPRNGATVTAPGTVGIVTPFDLTAFGAELLEDGDGNIIALRVGEDALPFPSALGESEIEPFQSQTLGTRARGTVFRGPDNFALYYLQEDSDTERAAEDVVYLLTGEPTRRDVILPGGGSDSVTVRAYDLSADFQK